MERKGSLWHTAYHEAGHAVAAIQLRVGIGRRGVSIVPEEDFAGFAHVLKGFRGRPDVEITGAMQVKMENWIIVCLAGPAAQRRFRPSSVRSYRASSDHHNAVELLSYMTGTERQLTAYFRLLRIRAENSVAKPLWWTMIDAVAEALMARKRLLPVEAKTIARDALGFPEPKPLKSPPNVGRGH